VPVSFPPPSAPTPYSAPATPRHRLGRRRRWRITVALAVAAACLGVAIAAGEKAHAELTRPPTAAQRSAAAAAAVAARWRSWPAGRIFPARLGYSTGLLTHENASRAGIGQGFTCAAVLDGAAASLASRDGCRAAVRAAYLDQLEGTVYTIGVLAFPSAARAAAFAQAAGAERLPAGLRALALPGTASVRFSEAARQAAVSRAQGPYAVLAVAGYADGRPAAATGQARPSVFSPARQLVRVIAARLAQPVTVNCASPEWSC
jgi:hypothetical protein